MQGPRKRGVLVNLGLPRPCMRIGRRLWSVGLRGVVFRWFSSYLSGMQNFPSRLQGHMSSTDVNVIIPCSVPQGSWLGPRLF